MTGVMHWLGRSVRQRTLELLSQFAHLAAEAGSEGEVIRAACEQLGALLGAEGVVFYSLGAEAERLVPAAASAPEWELTGEVQLADFPHWREALGGPASGWVPPAHGSDEPPLHPLFAARSVLVLPVRAQTRLLGCLAAAFEQAPGGVAAEERQAAEAFADVLALRLHQCALREEVEHWQSRHQARLRSSRDLRRPQRPLGLAAVVEACLQEGLAEAAALYRCDPSGLSRLATAGPESVFPPRLPLGDPANFPWQGVLVSGQRRQLQPEELSAGLDSWLPGWRGRALTLTLLPLGSPPEPLGVLLCASSSDRVEADEASEAWVGFLATALLERERLGQRLREARWRYQALSDLDGYGFVFFDATGRILFANRQLAEWTGVAAEEIDRRPLADFLDPTDWLALCDWLAARTTLAYESLVRWRARSSPWGSFRLDARQVSPSGTAEEMFLAVLRLPEERDPAAARAETEAACLDGLLDSVREGVWVIGPGGVVECANARLSQLFGLPLAEIGHGVSQRQAIERLSAHVESGAEAQARWESLAAHPEAVRWDELELVRPRRRVLEAFARPLYDAEHRLVARLEVYRDISGERLLEGKVVQRERLATLGQLLSGIAHELNNPLTAVTGYAELLLSDGLSPRLTEHVRRLAQEAERASGIVKNLLLFARGQRREKKPLALDEVLDQALALRAYELKIENIRLVRVRAPELPELVADAHQLQQVFLNILLNAEQAILGYRKQGVITARSGWDAPSGRVRVEISNDGPGIPAAVLPHLFDPFFTTRSAQGGTGLGLSISQAIVREYGGEITAYSGPEGGATFTLELPSPLSSDRPRSPRTLERPTPEPGPARPTGGGTHRRVLVVDDEPVVAHLIADALRKQGHTVRVHTDSRRALDEATQTPFQLIICDIRMPEFDGPAFHRALSQRRPDSARRILFTTGDTLAPETVSFLERVQLPYLAKPFHVDELYAAVGHLLAMPAATGPN